MKDLLDSSGSSYELLTSSAIFSFHLLISGGSLGMMTYFGCSFFSSVSQ